MSKKIKGMIDAGHGGTDRWNRGPSGYVEADGTLDIASRLESKLESTGEFEIELTRRSDTTLSLTERAQSAINFNPDFFLSVHDNAGPEQVRGVEVLGSVDLPGTEGLGSAICRNISEAFDVPNRGYKLRTINGAWDGKNSKEDYYTVIDKTQDGGIPMVHLVETLFHSNVYDERILKTESGRDKIAECIAKAYCAHYGVQYPPVSRPKYTRALHYKRGSSVMTGNDVKLVQERLKALGFYNGAIDGRFGPMSDAATRAFQKSIGIAVDGSVGPITWSKLFY